jgi:hypothetical protein
MPKHDLDVRVGQTIVILSNQAARLIYVRTELKLLIVAWFIVPEVCAQIC